MTYVQCQCHTTLHNHDRNLGPPTHSSVPEVSGGKIPVTYDESHFKARYLDEHTGEMLAHHLIRPAIEDELNYFNSKVWQLLTVEKMEKVPGYILVTSRWALCNKGDSTDPDVRARLMSCELNKGDRNDAFSTSTPPLEGNAFSSPSMHLNAPGMANL